MSAQTKKAHYSFHLADHLLYQVWEQAQDAKPEEIIADGTLEMIEYYLTERGYLANGERTKKQCTKKDVVFVGMEEGLLQWVVVPQAYSHMKVEFFDTDEDFLEPEDAERYRKARERMEKALKSESHVDIY